jgi:hypothetical protein
MISKVSEKFSDLRQYASSDAEFESLKKEISYRYDGGDRTLLACIDEVRTELARGTLKYTHPGASEEK